jgi:AcrR family transcriptional regulator
MVQQRAVLTKQRLVSAAADVFANDGFGAASLNDVTGAAKATKGALYFHFAGKDDLAATIVAEYLAPWPARIAAIRAAAPSPLAALVALTYEVAASLREEPVTRAGLRLCLDRDAIDAEIPDPFGCWISVFQELLAEARRDGTLRSGVTPAPAARVIVAGFFGVQQVSESLQAYEDIEARLDEFWKILLVGLTHDPDWSALQRASRRTLAQVHRAEATVD